MALVTVDGKQVEVPNDYTVLQACEEAGAEIPRFCYHERLAIAGNCRMCLVKIEKMPKPVASCAQPIADGMVITTVSPEVQAARAGVMEFLLINHPLDCPICDQAGECDLQDQSLKYGKGTSRFEEHKRAVEDKYMGPLIKTHMTRCIHCTRCVRFLEDVAGTHELGAIGRGEDMAITTYVEQSITSELSGNIVDLCPVGALTARPYAYKARSWELNTTQSVDVLDAVGSNIRVDSRGLEVMRILPRLCEEINEEWISDKTRFAYDGLKYQRLDIPMVKVNGEWTSISWHDAYHQLGTKIQTSSPAAMGAIAGDMVDVETMFAAKQLLNALGSKNHDCRQDGAHITNKNRADYIFNTTIAGIEEADFCLIVGSNPRHEAAIINARIRKAQIQLGLKVGVIGAPADLNYEYQYFGDTPWLLKQMSDGAHPFCEEMAKFKKPMLILGSGVLKRADAEAIMYHAQKLAFKYKFDGSSGWNGFNLLHQCASRVGGLDIGFIPGDKGLAAHQMLTQPMDVLFLLGADELDFTALNPKSYVVYLGHHGDRGAHAADMVLPAPAYTEKKGWYVNTEGRIASTYPAVSVLGEAKNEWLFFAELARHTGIELPHSLEGWRSAIIAAHPHFDLVGGVSSHVLKEPVQKGTSFALDKFSETVSNFYMTDPISRASKTMAECTKVMMETRGKVA